MLLARGQGVVASVRSRLVTLLNSTIVFYPSLTPVSSNHVRHDSRASRIRIANVLGFYDCAPSVRSASSRGRSSVSWRQ